MKGELEENEDPLAAAVREFAEETETEIDAAVCTALGDVRQKAGKVVIAWACEGQLDPEALSCGTFELEWPPRSGRIEEFPELDEVRWCSLQEAQRLLNPAQSAFVERLASILENP